MSLHTFAHKKTFKLENGKRIRDLQIAYHTYGELNEKRDNVVWVCHALTANSDVFEWWPGLFGEDDFFNPRDYFIVCANILGSPYGTSNPLSINPATGQPYYLSFPQFSTRDMASAHQLLATHLGLESIHLLIGGSMGGHQALEWAIAAPEKIRHLIVMATNAQHSPWGIAFNESQRLAIRADRTFFSNKPDGGTKGLKVARSMALLSYRGYDTYGATQLESDDEKTDDYKAASYQNYQGEKLAKRFNAYSYWLLSKAMDSHNLGRGRGGIQKALECIKARTLIIGINSDILFPPAEQKLLAGGISGAVYRELESLYGHDGFLIETEKISREIETFLAQTNTDKTPLKTILT